MLRCQSVVETEHVHGSSRRQPGGERSGIEAASCGISAAVTVEDHSSFPMGTADPDPFAVHPPHLCGRDVHIPAVSQQRAEIILRMPVLLDVFMLYHTVYPFDQLHQILILLLRAGLLRLRRVFPKDRHFLPPAVCKPVILK